MITPLTSVETSEGFTIVHVSWTINIILFAVVLYLLKETFVGRKRRIRVLRRDTMIESITKIENRHNLECLKALWDNALEGVKLPDYKDPIIKSVVALSLIEDDKKDPLIAAVREYVNIINSFAARMDVGLISAKSIAKEYPQLHRALIAEISLVEPAIWYESLVRARGRWGYRVLRLNKILSRTRCYSPHSTALDAHRVSIGEVVFLDLAKNSRARALLRRLWESVVPTRFSRRSKVQQNKIAELISEKLNAAGVATPNPGVITRARVW